LAYNSGPGRVNRAIRYADGQRDFRAIYRYLPRETRGYVPKFVAITYLFEYAEEHNLYPDESDYLPVYDTLQVSQYLHLDTFCKETGICVEDLEKLNPQIKHGAIPASAKNYPLKIPADTKPLIVERKDEIFATAGSSEKEKIEKMARNEVGAVAGRERVLYKVRSGDVLGLIAQRYHVRVADIKKWNRIRGSMIRVGQTLKIWVLPKYKNASTTPKKAVAKASSSPRPKPKPGQKTHYVLSGDTLWDISRAHNVSIDDIKKMNNMSDNRIKPGQTLIVGSE